MANNTDNPKFWTLDTTGVIVAVNVPVMVRRFVYYPAVVDDDVLVQEYLADETLVQAFKIKANHTDVNPVSIPFDPPRVFNGFRLATIDGGSLDVYLKK